MITQSGQKIYFKYEREDVTQGGLETQVPVAVTAVVVDSNYQLLAQGTARCSKSDNFVKETGRSIALKRAFAELRESNMGPLVPSLLEAYNNRA